MARTSETPITGPGPVSSPSDIAMTAPPPVTLSAADREALLALARLAVSVAVGIAPHVELEQAREALRGRGWRASAFVTLTEDGELRGCMGHLDPELPLAESVVEAASCAALLDPRFARVSARELAAIEVDVSVLGPMVPLAKPAAFAIGQEGIVVMRGGRRGLLLPEVASQLDDSAVAMLDTCCRKAGLSVGSWREPGTVVLAFRTDRFGGPAIA